MSKIALSSNNSGSATFTIASLGTNTNQMLTLPDASGTINVSGLANEVPAGSNTAPAIYSTGDNNTGLFFPAADTVAVTTGGIERMRIDASGNLLVGTTTSAQTLSTNNVLTLKAPGIANVWGVGPTSSFGSFYVSTSGTGVSLAGGSTSWGTVSDERQKDIIEPIADAVAKVLSLRSVIGKYKTDSDGTRRSFLIAQDVQAALPEAIDVGEDEANTLSVKYTEIIPLLVAAIKEQQALIADLTARVAELEAK